MSVSSPPKVESTSSQLAVPVLVILLWIHTCDASSIESRGTLGSNGTRNQIQGVRRWRLPEFIL